MFCWFVLYNENQEDDIKTIIYCILSCNKLNSFTSNLFNHLLSEMGLFTLHTAQRLPPPIYSCSATPSGLKF